MISAEAGDACGRIPRLIYDASETCADLLYLSGFMAPDPFLWYEDCQGQPLVIVSALEVARAGKSCRAGTTVLSMHEARQRLGVKASESDVIPELIAALCRQSGSSRIAVPGAFPLLLARKLAERGVDARPLEHFCPDRATKSASEVEMVRTAVRLAEAGLARGLDILKQARGERPAGDVLVWEGRDLTAERLRGEIDCEIARRGGTASRTIVAPGVQGADPHEVGYGPIRAGEPIVIDIFPQMVSTGYHGDLTRTVVVGQAADVVRRAFEAVREARDAARCRFRAGEPLNAPHRIAEQILTGRGFKTNAKAAPPYGFFHGLGHGLGLQVHEPPRVNARARGSLEIGNVVTVEPGLYYPEWGGMRLEDVVAVTAEGNDLLTSVPTFLEL